ncbi:MAG TPA: glutathione S-transferase [Gallionellaceae bacterium]|nr:glutathione S-transferase [Gallionellaceae bacterium]
MRLELYIGNKNYSSWSLRAWLLLRHLGLNFTEHMVSVAARDYNPALKHIAGNARVPCLHEDGFQIWESLAIAEHLAERHPELWPADERARTRARCVSAEMHSGFAHLRRAMPFNLKYRLKGKPAAPEVQREIDRVVEIWTEARTQFARDDGPYLFGRFSAADAMFAPIACRFHTYNVNLTPVAQAWCNALLAHPAMKEWYAAASRETETVPKMDAVAEEYGGAREDDDQGWA